MAFLVWNCILSGRPIPYIPRHGAFTSPDFNWGCHSVGRIEMNVSYVCVYCNNVDNTSKKEEQVKLSFNNCVCIYFIDRFITWNFKICLEKSPPWLQLRLPKSSEKLHGLPKFTPCATCSSQLNKPKARDNLPTF